MFTIYTFNKKKDGYVSFCFKPYSLKFYDYSLMCYIASSIDHSTCIKIDWFFFSSVMNEYQLFIHDKATFDRFRVFCECENILC